MARRLCTLASGVLSVPRPRDSGYGLGIIYEQGKGFGHGGLLPGNASHMFYDPNADVGAVIYCNIFDFNNRDAQLAVMTDVYNRGRRVLGY